MLLVPLLALTLFVFALVDIILRPSDQVRHLPKLAWVFIVILLPLIGSILWFALGREYAQSAPRPRRTVIVRKEQQAPQQQSSHRTRPLSTEEQLAAVEEEIAYHQRQERIRQLEQEVRARRDTSGDAAV
ncbi:PLD nuclease N-terminal domain-containing protein [Leifsonia sp. PS1209]|uniref:PLD nuclease N-terminal domain-containing protein n=1 Tax=Leifsonia sp. PS1209 TaxID=2724914 RepID=UPI001442B965|nr:PLD nuclease N-terminal domain-containing protein [Leifsonia sp. PS1209]QIZ99486.1 PLDc_N domain-containing protein [Leifsonia sp. PS1209]